MKSVIVISAGLVGLYLALSYATGAGRLLEAGGRSYSGIIKTFQGR